MVVGKIKQTRQFPCQQNIFRGHGVCLHDIVRRFRCKNQPETSRLSTQRGTRQHLEHFKLNLGGSGFHQTGDIVKEVIRGLFRQSGKQVRMSLEIRTGAEKTQTVQCILGAAPAADCVLHTSRQTLNSSLNMKLSRESRLQFFPQSGVQELGVDLKMKTHFRKVVSEKTQKFYPPFLRIIECAVEKADLSDSAPLQRRQFLRDCVRTFKAQFCPAAGAVETAHRTASRSFHLHEWFVCPEEIIFNGRRSRFPLLINGITLFRDDLSCSLRRKAVQKIREQTFAFPPEDSMDEWIPGNQMFCAAAQTFRSADCNMAGGIESMKTFQNLSHRVSVEQIKSRAEQTTLQSVQVCRHFRWIVRDGCFQRNPFPAGYFSACGMKQRQCQRGV